MLLLAAVLLLVFCGCQGEEESSAPSTEGSVEPEAFNVERAIELIERDRLATEIFINNSLCKRSDSANLKAVDGEYSEFSAIVGLLDSTYTESGGCKEAFLKYPEGHIPSVSAIEDKTYVFNHVGSEYDDFVMTSTVKLENGRDENEMLIKATTRTMNELTFTARLTENGWRLEKGIYFLNPPTATECNKEFPLSSLGSFGEFKGKITVIELFVSDKEAGFTSAEEDEYHARISKCLDFLCSNAEAYGGEVEIVYEKRFFDHSEIMGTRPLDFDIVFAETGFGTLKSFAEATVDLSDSDGYVFAVCMDKEAEMGYTANEGTKETELYYGEKLIVGNNTSNADICRSLIYLLGGYGYDEELCGKYEESLFRNYFPNDIMINSSLDDSVISPVTAYACGMTDELDPLYRVFFYE